jgi:hypothetical protein
MAHDRTGDNTLPLTHEFLSLMLAVRRAGRLTVHSVVGPGALWRVIASRCLPFGSRSATM